VTIKALIEKLIRFACEQLRVRYDGI
jgi:hypothetical protein